MDNQQIVERVERAERREFPIDPSKMRDVLIGDALALADALNEFGTLEPKEILAACSEHFGNLQDAAYEYKRFRDDVAFMDIKLDAIRDMIIKYLAPHQTMLVADEIVAIRRILQRWQQIP